MNNKKADWVKAKIYKAYKIYHTYLSKKHPRGIDVFYDIKKYDIFKILDIGANIGMFYREARKTFPKAKIYSYEPVLSSYNELKKINPHSFRLAISDHNGAVYITNDKGPMNRIFSEGQELVPCMPIDSFHSSSDLCKIDVEGHELQVLDGMKETLKHTKFVLIECTFDPDNDYHTHINKIIPRLYGFKIFGIYEQVGEWVKNKPQLRKADVLFINTLI